MSESKAYVRRLGLIAALGGLLFGYDTAVISGTIGAVTQQFDLSTGLVGWYVSSALVGCIGGVAVAGYLSDLFGRKPMLLISGALFGISALGCMWAVGYSDLVIYRLLGGVGVGIASMMSPLYIAEISPARSRGGMVALYQFAITVGILFAYFANAFVLHLLNSGTITALSPFMLGHSTSEYWRVMLGSEILPAVLFFILLLGVPRSPRWLIVKGQENKARTVLSRMVDEAQAEREIKEVQMLVAEEQGGLRVLLQRGFRGALIMGVVLAFLTQVSGINAIIYYGPTILEEVGLKLSDALGGQVIIGAVNVLATLIAIFSIDRLGRKPLLLAGVCGIVVSLFCVGLLFYLDIQNPYLLMTFILLFIACFAFSYGPVIWVLLSEIFPATVRGTAMSIATLSVWIGTAFVGQITPWLLENLQPHGTFWFFMVCTLPAIYMAVWVMPETKGKTLEEIEAFWVSKNQGEG